MKELKVSIPLSGQLVCNKLSKKITLKFNEMVSQSPYRVNWFVIISEVANSNGHSGCPNPLIGSIGL